MIKNFFSIALRTLWNNRVFSAINILGLSIGISASLVIFLLVQYEFSFDKQHPGGERIYRVVTNFTFSGEAMGNSGVTVQLAKAVPGAISGLEATAMFRTTNEDPSVTIKEANTGNPLKFRHERHVVYADRHYFSMFPYEWIAGSPATSLQQPYQVVLTDSLLSKYFPGLTPASAIGRELFFNDTVRTVVSGVIKPLQQRSDLSFSTFISLSTLNDTRLKPEDWENWGSTTSATQLYVRLAPGTQPAQTKKLITELYNKNHKEEDSYNKTVYELQPLSNLHFEEGYGTYGEPTAHKPTLYGLMVIAVFLLLLGCINFINLTTAQASRRAKEVGIRKTMGSSRKQLTIRFLAETFLLTILAVILSCAMVPLLLKAFSGFIPPRLQFNLIQQPAVWLFLLGLALVVSLLSGFYPAYILTRFKPVLVLKNQAYANTHQSRTSWLRKTLTVSQFVVAQVFIIATLLVSQQISYSLTMDMGFRKDAIVWIRNPWNSTVKDGKQLLAAKLRGIPEIAMLSLSNNPPTGNATWSSTFKYHDGKKEISTNVQLKQADTNYVPMYQMKLLAGRNLTASDTTTEFLINETYTRILGFQHPADAVGKYIKQETKPLLIVGVVQDFHQKSLHEPIKPLMIGNAAEFQDGFNILLQPRQATGDTWKRALQKIENTWKKVYPEEDFEYKFVDETIAEYYGKEQRTARLLHWATGLSVFISCLGLLGLVIFTTTQRTKEIGVRKVLGASLSQIVALLSKDLLLLVMLAFALAVPLAWWGMHRWLEQFAYRTDISWWIFIISGAAMAFIALLTLSLQTIRAAMANPVKSLRTE